MQIINYVKLRLQNSCINVTETHANLYVFQILKLVLEAMNVVQMVSVVGGF